MNQVFASPLFVMVGRKKFSLNLNVYRKTHYQILNKAKKNYQAVMHHQISKAKPTKGQVKIAYKLFAGSRTLVDLGNVISVHKKFFEDALVSAGKIKDDNYTIVIESKESFGGIDKKFPRVEITVTEVKA